MMFQHFTESTQTRRDRGGKIYPLTFSYHRNYRGTEVIGHLRLHLTPPMLNFDLLIV